jgi:hypothetical protein
VSTTVWELFAFLRHVSSPSGGCEAELELNASVRGAGERAVGLRLGLTITDDFEECVRYTQQETGTKDKTLPPSMVVSLSSLGGPLTTSFAVSYGAQLQVSTGIREQGCGNSWRESLGGDGGCDAWCSWGVVGIGRLQVYDIEKLDGGVPRTAWNAHAAHVTAMCCIRPPAVALLSAATNGTIGYWDLRKKPNKPAMAWSQACTRPFFHRPRPSPCGWVESKRSAGSGAVHAQLLCALHRPCYP